MVAVLHIAACLPLSVSRWLGSVMASAAILINSRSWVTTQKNLELCFPGLTKSQRRALAKRSMQETGKLMLETGAVWLKPYAWVESRITGVYGLEKLRSAIDSPKGLVVLAPHTGNWEILGLYLAHLTPLTNLYQPPEYAALDRLMRTSREKSGAVVVPTDRRGVMQLIKVLKQGGVTGILPDQQPELGPGSDFAPFFNVPALTMTLVTNLGRKSDSAYLAAVAKRVRGGWEIHFLDAEEGIDSEDKIRALTALNKTVERCVEIAPEQYQWEYKRFRKQPDGKQNPYRLPLE